MRGGYVDGDTQVVSVLFVPRNGGFACRAHDPLADWYDKAGLLGHRDKFKWRDESAALFAVVRLEPAQQRFGADDLSGLQVKLRLVMQTELVGFHRCAQITEHLEALLHGVVEILRIFLDRVAPFFLGAVERDIGVFQNLIRVHAIVGECRNADRGAHLELLVEHPERFGTDCVDDFFRNVAGAVDIGGQRHGDGELVGIDAGDSCRFWHRGAQSFADAAQDRIAHVVPHGVVDILEVVEVERDNGKAFLLAVGGGTRVFG